MNLKPNSLKLLDVSTCHISLKTRLALDRDMPRVYSTRWSEYGWIISTEIPDDGEAEELLQRDYPDLLRLIQLALDEDCEFLKLDRDALPLPLGMAPIYEE